MIISVTSGNGILPQRTLCPVVKRHQGSQIIFRYSRSAHCTKLSEILVRTLRFGDMRRVAHAIAEESDSDDDEDDDDEVIDEDPVVEPRSVPHTGGVNRVRAQPLPQLEPLPPVSQPYYVASWAETGKVHIWDVRSLIEALDTPGYVVPKERTNAPVFSIASHGRAEGFALDWAASGGANPSALRLLTGDVHAKIFLTTTTPSGFNALAQPFASHTSSVEDLQWSPSEPTVFASCSADQSVQIWDVRSRGRRSVAGIEHAHPSDVNVISWNKSSTYLLLSGGDEGGINVWDLRNVKPNR